MRKINFRKLLFVVSLCLFTGTFLFAQEKENKKVHIIVKENDATTVDTSFTIDEDMDKDEIQKMIHELTGMDVMVRHKDDLIVGGSGGKKIDFFVYDGDKGKLDSLKKYHKDEIVIGYFDDEDTEGMKKKHWVMKKKMSDTKMAQVYAYSIKDSVDFDTDVDVKEIKIKVTIDDDGESHAAIYNYINGDHMKWVDNQSGNHYVIVEVEDGKELELSVKDKKTGTDIALDKLKVITIETTKDGIINIVVSDKKEKEEKKTMEEKKKKVNKKK